MTSGADRFGGKVVVVTGGGAGIGRMYARRFAAEGAAIVIADVDQTAGRRVVGEIEGDGGRAVSAVMDVSDTDAAVAMVDQAMAAFGGVDILVNNAGIHLDHAQLPFTLDALPAWRRVLDVNVFGALICSVACRPAMAARGGGAIVNMSSVSAYMAGSAYNVSKLAVNSLTVSLAGELGPDGIRVNGIAPALVDSEAAVEWWNDPSRTGVERIDQVLISQQMIRRQVRMGDVADVCLFLCSDAASLVTGQTVVVDGGFLKRPF
jgi:NAD(P)-dependent dehydrogenase (short-subunit alcohol dehydrogenase family)